MKVKRLLLNLNIAFDAVMGNLFRSVLTALGIIFGVAAVIAMLAIGQGAQQEILDQIKLVGVNNIVISPVPQDDELNSEENGKEKTKKFSPGLSLKDAKAIEQVLPGIAAVSPEAEDQIFALRKGVREKVNLIGIVPKYFETYNFKIRKGNGIAPIQNKRADAVCVIGKGVEARFFSGESAIGQYIKCGTIWLKVIGITEKINSTKESRENLNIRDYDMDIYLPIETFLGRFNNSKSNENYDDNGNKKKSKGIYHQLDRITVQMKSSEDLIQARDILATMLMRRHNQMEDVNIDVPIMMLRQQQRTKDIFNIVLGCIAGISLLVGGIGIMNIMLASVYERIKEIGIRMSMGATQKDIIQQFLLEAVIISLSGGLIGILAGVIISFIISSVTDIKTLISIASIFISFGVSASVGLIFGLMPARKAAKQDPINSLRYE